MAFVPGFRNDIFLSYAHGDDAAGAAGEGWVSHFWKRLKAAIQQRLGPTVSIWMDKRDLTHDVDFDREIHDQLDSAIVIAIASPNYSRSRYCKKERSYYEEVIQTKHQAMYQKGALVNSQFRFKAVILTDEEASHREYWKEISDANFYQGNGDQSRPLSIASAAFEEALYVLEIEVCRLLRKMRNQCLPVFLWPPALSETDVDKKRLELANELTEGLYRVLPERETDYLTEQSEAKLSVFLLGSAFDQEVELLIDAAIRQGKTWAAWESAATKNTTDPRQIALLEKVRASKARGLFDQNCSLKEEVLELLKPSARLTPQPETGDTRKQIFLLYDQNLEDEKTTASYVSYALQEEFEVSESCGTYSDDKRNLVSADGVLLLWGVAERSRYANYFSSMKDLARRARSKGICLFDPRHNKVQDLPFIRGLKDLHVIEQFDGFDPAKLEPFLTRLRTQAGAAS
jgi:hypothetical protein